MLGPPTCSGASIGETARTDGSGVFSVFRRYFLFGSAGGHLVQTGSLPWRRRWRATGALDGKVSPNTVVVQVPGPAAVVKAELRSSETIRRFAR